MSRFHLDIRNAITILTDKSGRECDSMLEAMALAKAALEALAAAGAPEDCPWIEVSDARGSILATVRLDERPN